MTEKEFLRSCYRAGFQSAPKHNLEGAAAGGVPSLNEALALAKQHGARFDPEPVKLAKLSVGQYEKDRVFKNDGEGYLIGLSPEETAEVVRRCNLWDGVIHRLRGANLGTMSINVVLDYMHQNTP